MAGALVVDTLKSSTANPPVFQNTSGVEIGQLCRAWVNFNGVTTATIRASYNVSSVIRNAGGDYTINFTNAMTDANYVMAGQARVDSFAFPMATSLHNTVAPTTSAVRIFTGYTGSVSANGALAEPSYATVAIFR